jgi:hypothetical protein
MKCLSMFLLLYCFTNYDCSAQVLEDDSDPAARRTNVPPRRTLVTVTFVTADTCNVTINNQDYGNFVKSKTLKLALGNYKLFFESLENGKTTIDRSFRLTRDKVTGGTFNYVVTFK